MLKFLYLVLVVIGIFSFIYSYEFGMICQYSGGTYLILLIAGKVSASLCRSYV